MIRSMFIPCALHGVEASFFADTGLRKLRTAIFKVVWSDRQPLANSAWLRSCFLCCLVSVSYAT